MVVEDLKFCMASVLVAIKMKSMQRPAVMCNCTIDEYNKAVIEDGVTFIRVKSHKTGASGSARLLSSGLLAARMRNLQSLACRSPSYDSLHPDSGSSSRRHRGPRSLRQ